MKKNQESFQLKYFYSPAIPESLQQSLPLSTHFPHNLVNLHVLGLDVSTVWLQANTILLEALVKMIPDDKCLSFAEGEHLQVRGPS